MTKLSLHEVSLRLGTTEVVTHASLEVQTGELVGIIGANGAGKTSLLKMLSGIISPSEGCVLMDEKPLPCTVERAQRIAFLEQGAQSFWALEVSELVGLGRLPYRTIPTNTTAHDREIIDRCLRETDSIHLVGRKVNTLSLGERARVMLARALAVGSEFIMVDEPATALDPAHQLAVMELLRRRAVAGAGVVAVLHDLTMAVRFCERLVLMHDGKILAIGAPHMVLTPENMRQALQLEVLQGDLQGVPFILPVKHIV